jgi:hypothetical protein
MNRNPRYPTNLQAKIYTSKIPAQKGMVYWSYPNAAMISSPVCTQLLAFTSSGVHVSFRSSSSLSATPTKAYLRYESASANLQPGNSSSCLGDVKKPPYRREISSSSARTTVDRSRETHRHETAQNLSQSTVHAQRVSKYTILCFGANMWIWEENRGERKGGSQIV